MSTTATKESKTQLATIDPERFAVTKADAADMLAAVRENLCGQQLSPKDLDRIKVPSGGGLAWTVPGPEGETAEKVVTGVVVHHQRQRAYWQGTYNGQKNPPQCVSDDCVTGIGDPGGQCSSCPLAQFGSKEGSQAQACKQMHLLFLVRETDSLPVVIVAPPSSLQNVQKYMLRLASQGKAYHSVITSFSLQKAQSQAGIAYSQIVPCLAQPLPPDAAAKFKKYGDAIRPALQKVRAEQADFEG